MSAGFWSGDEWRWSLNSRETPYWSISVIEPASKRDIPATAHRVPFGFARALGDDKPAVKPHIRLKARRLDQNDDW